MLYRRPVIAPLDLELAEIRTGYTDRDLDQIRYEGRLSDGRVIRIGCEGGDIGIEVQHGHDFNNGHPVMSEYPRLWKTGPGFGTFSAAQICDLYGIRVASALSREIDLSDREKIWRGSYLDWSGNYGYFWKQIYLSKQAGAGFVAELQAIWPDLKIFSGSLHEGNMQAAGGLSDPGDQLILVLDPGDHPSDVIELGGPYRRLETLPRGSVVINFSRDTPAFNKAARSELAQDGVEVWSNARYGWFFAKFREGAADQEMIETVCRIADKAFSNRAEDIDLATNMVVKRYEGVIWYGRQQVDWCQSSPRRFIRVHDLRWKGGILTGTRLLS